MALPAYETFTNSDGTALAAHSASWTIVNGAIVINSNKANSTQDNYDACLARWNADTFDNDQYSQADFTHANGDGSNLGGVACRLASGAVTGYQFTANFDASQLQRTDSAFSNTTLSSSGSSPTGTVARIEASGSTITCLSDGSTTGMPAASTDSTYTSGSAGIAFEQDGTNAQIDNWEGGNLVAGGTIHEVATTFAAINAQIQIVDALFEAATALNATIAQVQLQDSAVDVAASLLANATITQTNDQVSDVAASLPHSNFTDASNTYATDGFAAFDAVNNQSQISGLTIDEAVALAILNNETATALITIEGVATFTAANTLEQSGIQFAELAATILANVSQSIQTNALIGVDSALASTLVVSQVGSTLSLTIAAPAYRTFDVEVEARTITVVIENRTCAVDLENRTIYIS